MKIYDISQEVFGCSVYPGDPAPERKVMMSIGGGGVCNLTAISMCAHNGTHVDAPYHFIDGGKTIDRIPLQRWIGYAYVAVHEGELSAADAEEILRKAGEAAGRSGIPDCDASGRILVRGKTFVSEAAAEVFANRGVLLFGNESQTVGPEDAPAAVHRILLGRGTVLLEGIRLGEVKEGIYFLNAAPLNLGGADGAPCRAWLMEA